MDSQEKIGNMLKKFGNLSELLYSYYIRWGKAAVERRERKLTG